MTEKPILFSGEMVRAILDGRKTQTRRVIKPQPIVSENGWATWGWKVVGGQKSGRPGRCFWHAETWQREQGTAPIDRYSPYGRPGDFLWVREAWKPGAWRDNGRIAIDYKASPELTNTPWLTIPEDYTGKQFNELWPQWTDELLAAGSVPDRHGIHHWAPGKSPLKWRPSIFMPRWASRITLQVTAVRVERLHEMSEFDMNAEGVASPGDDKGIHHITPFVKLWDSINEKNGYGWDSNPWCWCVSFEAVSGQEATE